MKTKIFALFFCFFSLFFVFTTKSENRAANRLYTIGINYYNTTAYTCTIELSGPTNKTITVPPGTTGSFGPISPGNYIVGIYTTGPGTYHYNLNAGGNTPTYINNANGHGAVYSVNAQYNLTASITN